MHTGQEPVMMFKSNIRMRKILRDFSNFARGVVVGARWDGSSISETRDQQFVN